MRDVRRIAILLAAVLPAVLFAQITTPAGNATPDQKCVIAGRVVSAQTGEALKKVAIRLTQYGANIPAGSVSATISMQNYSATSEADGSFVIQGIEPGSYFLSGQRSGYLNTSYGAKGPAQRGTILNLQPARQMTDITLQLTPQAVISGKVVDADGDPVDRAMVQAMKQTWQRGKLRYEPRESNPTNDLGEFRIASLAPGKYYLCAEKENFFKTNDTAADSAKPDIRPIRTCYPEATVFSNATPVEVTAGQDAPGVNIRLQSAPTFHVRGRVAGVLASDEAQRTQIFLLREDEQQTSFMGGQTNVGKDRTFDIAGVAPGSYVLYVLVMQGPIRMVARQPVEVGHGDVNDAVVTLMPPGSIRGQIRVEGSSAAGSVLTYLAGVRVSLIATDFTSIQPSPPTAQSKADGTFTIDNVAPGKYYVQANAPNGTYLNSVSFGGQEVAGKELDLSASASGDLEIVFRYGVAELDGTVQSAQTNSASQGQAARSATIVLVPDTLNADGSGMRFVSANQGGVFAFRQLAPGHYRAYAFEQVDAGQLQDPDVLKELEGGGVDVDLQENDRKQIQLTVIPADELQQIFAKLGIDSGQ